MHESFVRRSGLLMPLFFLLLGCDGGSSTDTAATAPSTTAPQATVTQTVNDQPGNGAAEVSVDSESLPYAEVGDDLIYGHFAFPSDMTEPLPAVIVVHDIWGLNDDVKTFANNLAAEGYMVLAIDLFQGSTTDDVVQARQHTVSVVEDPEVTADNLRQALVFVGIAGAPLKATLGFGLGGSVGLDAAQQNPDEISAAVVYYGQVPSDDGRLDAIGGPVLGLFGARDRSVSVSSVTEFEATMRRLGKDPQVEIYPDAGHGFANTARGTFDADTASDAWNRTLEFLATNLPSSDTE